MAQAIPRISFLFNSLPSSSSTSHKDLKPNNLLVTASGVVKIADFGLAISFGSPSREYTSQVVTIWYRAPELLYGAKAYGPGVDMWAMGCILAELELRTPLLPGENDLDQLSKIFHLCGTPTGESWPGMEELVNFVRIKPFPRVPFAQVLTAASDTAVDLLEKLLVCNPSGRLTCSQALQHPFFSSAPGPTPPEDLPLPLGVRSMLAEVNKEEAAVETAAAAVAAAAAGQLMPGQAVARRPLVAGGASAGQMGGANLLSAFDEAD